MSFKLNAIIQHITLPQADIIKDQRWKAYTDLWKPCVNTTIRVATHPPIVK